MEPLRIAVVGAGGIAQRNAREAVASGAAEVVSVFDVNHRAARDMARSLRAGCAGSYAEVLTSKEVETVLLSTPHHLHRPMTIEAAAHGKHVMVEKPVANNLDDALQMYRACRDAGVQLTVNYSFRYLPKILKARQLIEAGSLGEIVGIQIINHQYKDRGYWSGARSNSPDDWRASREKCGGGFLIMNVCHVIDYVYFLTGLKAKHVYSEYATLGSRVEVEDIVNVSFRLTNGAVGTISASSIMRGADQAEERIWGTNGTMILGADGLAFYSTRPVDGRRPGKLHHIQKFDDVSWTAEWVKGFANAVRLGTRPAVSHQEAWDNLAFIQTAYESMNARRPIEVPEFPVEA
jgi:predicted dehydrogenase